MRGVTAKTPERVAEAIALREQGWIYRDIAEHLGIARETAVQWVRDPDGTKLRARKDSYARPCIDCGGPTSGSQGRRPEPRCLQCATIIAGESRKIWTREAVALAIKEWAHRYGEPPAMADWCHHRALVRLGDGDRARRAEREMAAGAIPSVQGVIRAFGSWNAAIEASGFAPRAGHGGSGNQLRRRYLRSAR